MQYNVAQLMKEHTGAARHFPVDQEIRNLSDPDVRIEAPLTGDITLMKDTDGILVTGHLATQVAVPCARCLEPVSVPVEFDVEEQYYPTIDVETGRRMRTPDDADPDTLIDGHHILDISELVRQSIMLAVPISPVHPDGCEALDGAEGETDEAADIDPRWSGLSSLRDQTDGA